ncbi:Protein of unknown function [Bacillus cereus]|nr:hypothetical protein TU62_07270 [Bacillus cereus]MBG9856418.1 hypothetical protein [Bacillus wiedmannii]PFZ86968.1 hypothetical protein COL83_26710 [Bacillus wiedmannii]SCC48344.1 Protein of unknown function [Bacillus cereus]SCN35893.1 Protein of unknown function [Bacillus wiedmannii]
MFYYKEELIDIIKPDPAAAKVLQEILGVPSISNLLYTLTRKILIFIRLSLKSVKFSIPLIPIPSTAIFSSC